ncbi:MAG: hypothetical protein IKW45_03755 [Clostridia bacterium]|nr:hypothetical protein [Clostridia bacterium]
MIWKTKKYNGETVTWYSEDEMKKADAKKFLKKICWFWSNVLMFQEITMNGSMIFILAILKWCCYLLSVPIMIISKSFFAIYDYIVQKECKYVEDIRLLVGNVVNKSEGGKNAKI